MSNQVKQKRSAREGRTAPQPCSELARVLLMHAVEGILDGCGNSYVNAYTEQWLTRAQSLGAYHGPVVGTISNVKAQWNEWLEVNGLPDWPDVLNKE